MDRIRAELSESPGAPASSTPRPPVNPPFIRFVFPNSLLSVEHLGWCPVAQGLMGPQMVVEPEVILQSFTGFVAVGVSLQVHLLVLHVRHSRSTKTLSEYRPFPSMLILTPRSCRTSVNSRLVNWLPWSVLDTSGFLRARASSSASAQKLASRVLDSRQATTYRLCQSITATR